MFARLRKTRLRLGRDGENAACELLRCRGMAILARNWRCRAGELDIVALDGEQIVFVEVKTMRDKKGFAPAANLSARQRRRNCNAGKVYMRALDIRGRSARFDLVEATFRGPFLIRLVRHPDYLPQLAARAAE